MPRLNGRSITCTPAAARQRGGLVDRAVGDHHDVEIGPDLASSASVDGSASSSLYAGITTERDCPRHRLRVPSRPSIAAPFLRRPHIAFIVIACVFGIAFALTLPPLAGADEGVHFLRAWHVSNGHVFAEYGHRAGDPAPDSARTFRPASTRVSVIPHRRAAEPHQRPQGVVARVGSGAARGGPCSSTSRRPRCTRRCRTSRARSASASAGCSARRRSCSCCSRGSPTSPRSSHWSRSRSGGSRRASWVLAILALTPVVVFQAATVSADVVTTALALVVIADALALDGPPRRRRTARLLDRDGARHARARTVRSSRTSSSAALLLLPAWRHRRSIGAVARRRAGGRRRARARPGPAGRTTTTSRPTSCRHARRPPELREQQRADHRSRSTTCSGDPFAFVRAVGRTVTDHGVNIARTTRWRRSRSGTCPGWIAFLVAFGVIAMVVDRRRTPRGRAADGVDHALARGRSPSCVSLFLAYVGWNSVHAPRIDGFQGRYLAVRGRDDRLVIRGAPARRRGSRPASRLPIEPVACGSRAWSALMLLAVEIGLAWHSYG